MFQHPHKSFAQVPRVPTACWSSGKLTPQLPVEQQFTEPLSRTKTKNLSLNKCVRHVLRIERRANTGAQSPT